MSLNGNALNLHHMFYIFFPTFQRNAVEKRPSLARPHILVTLFSALSLLRSFVYYRVTISGNPGTRYGSLLPTFS
jgi:hypothetical protein